MLAKLQSLNLPPSPPASDAEFLRRAFVDTIGVLPTADEARAFLADTSPDKRDKLIEHLLARPEFVDYWTYKWTDLLLVNSEKLRPAAMWAYYHWIRNNVAANTPWDEFARDLVTATGSTLENGAANFFVLHQDPPELAETVSVAFLGMSINCAKCHNHPLEKWTNDQYYGMANLFARVRAKEAPGEGNRVVYPVDHAASWCSRAPASRSRRARSTARPLPFDAEADRRAAPGRLADGAGESVLQPGDHQPRLGQLLRRRPGRKRRRPAAHQPGQQRRAARRGGQVPGRPQVRPQGADAGDPAVGHLRAARASRCRRTPTTSGSIRATIRGG